MSTANDPFAVSFYDPDKLPAVSAKLSASAPTDVLMLHLLLDEEGAFEQPIAVYDYLATQVLASYQPGAWRILDPALLFPRGVTTVSGGWEKLADASVPVEQTDAQKQERRARLSAAIRLKAQNSNEYPRANVRRALVYALDLETSVRKRKEATKIACIEGRYLAEGKSLEPALKATVADVGCSPGKVRALRLSPGYIARRNLHRDCALKAMDRIVVEPHAADSWFMGERIEAQIASADRVAAHIITLMQEDMRGKSKKGKRPLVPHIHLRWDAFNMVEGFANRYIPLTPIACLMLDHALGLYGCDGNAVPSPFGGIKKREAFVAAAEYEGTEDGANIGSEYHLCADLRSRGDPEISPKQLRIWRGREPYQTITATSRAAVERR